MNSREDLVIRPVTREQWPDFEALFEAPGSPKYCWCMLWRPKDKGKVRTNAEKKSAMRRLVLAESRVGLLGYLGNEPVCWCSVSPKSDYRKLGGEDEDSSEVWSLTCLFVKRKLRGRGYSKRLILAAVDCARDNGGRAIEAYPVDEDSPSYKFMGIVPVFEALGFTRVGKVGARRHIFRLELG